jgi:hypothetical protein
MTPGGNPQHAPAAVDPRGAGRGVQNVYAIKGRASTKPLAICVADVPDVAIYAHTAHLPRGLLQQLLPGACLHAISIMQHDRSPCRCGFTSGAWAGHHRAGHADSHTPSRFAAQ